MADLLGVPLADYTSNQMTYDLRRLCLKGLIYRPRGTNCYFLTPHGWKMACLFSRPEARVPTRHGDVHRQRCRLS